MTTHSPKRQPLPFGDYLLLDRFGIGGMAEIWRAKMFGAEGLGRLVALKRILPHFADDEEFISMFLDEGRIGLQLLHANVAQAFELGQIGPYPFLSQEYVPGKSLGELFDHFRRAATPMPLPMACYCISRMCAGLDYAHRKTDGRGRELNIVHRGLSLDDVLISFEGDVKVIDFGIAKAAGRVTQTQPGILKGKIGYMSPEQIDGSVLDRRSDVFAIGVCLYELLTGQRPFMGDSDLATMELTRKAQATPPSSHNPFVPRPLDRIVLQALAKDVRERYAYASELEDQLQDFLIHRDANFDREDLRQYMRTTFSEDIQRETQRQREYARIEPPKDFDIH
ncbi:serine/threonine protein kinase [Hyalangium versicolor]|uniref:serine/threonine protein kinase n=1 Tax=Hyalangium versicolor TaxID=2861190 RepID=UPI001CCAE4C6|nr:serine/threonine-protein kinase [Hyalangium versicolor]